jgi:putative oxidoreductase
MYTKIAKLLFRANNGIADLLLRIPVGVVFSAHGYTKILEFEKTVQAMSSLGLEPATLMAGLATGTEFLGGLALIAGLMSRPAGLGLAFTMLIAWITVHGKGGLFLHNNGFEYVFVLMGVSLYFVFAGAGRWSIDALIDRYLQKNV